MNPGNPRKLLELPLSIAQSIMGAYQQNPLFPAGRAKIPSLK
jgi:hypothetical protein